MGIKQRFDSVVNSFKQYVAPEVNSISPTRSDGWANIFTGMGYLGSDKTESTEFIEQRVLDRGELESLYRSNGLLKRIVDLIPNEMTRQGWTLEGDPENILHGKLDELSAFKKITSALKWARLYGGSIIVLGIDDGLEFDQPVRPEFIRDIKYLHVFDRESVFFGQNDLYQDPFQASYNTPEIYNVQPRLGKTYFRVHESRVLRFDGNELPDNLLWETGGWGDSIVQTLYSSLKYHGTALKNASLILEDFIQTLVTIDGLSDILAAGNDDLIQRRLNLMNQSRHVARLVVLDGTEKFEKSSSSISGLDTMIDKFAQNLASVTGIPITLLMGESPAGLNATGASDIRIFYDFIKQQQQDSLAPQLEKLYRYLLISKDGHFRGKEPENWNISFNALWQMDEITSAQHRKIIAETDAIYINTNVLDPNEVAISRFGGDSYSPETTIDTTARENPDPGPTEEEIELEVARRQNLALQESEEGPRELIL